MVKLFLEYLVSKQDTWILEIFLSVCKQNNSPVSLMDKMMILNNKEG